MELRPGVGIAHFTHYLRRWNPARQVRVNSGVERRGGSWLPREDWRSPTPSELLHLAGGAAGIHVFTVPDRLRARFLDLEVSPGRADKETQVVLRESADFLRFISVPVGDSFRLSLRIEPGGAPPAAGLGVRASRGSAVGAAVNLGDEEACLLFSNLSVGAMQDAVGAAGSTEATAVLETFTSRFPDYPVTSLALGPGEGFFARLDEVPHAIATSGPTLLLDVAVT